MITLQDKNGVKLGNMCCNDRAGASFIDTIGTFVCQKLLENIENVTRSFYYWTKVLILV